MDIRDLEFEIAAFHEENGMKVRHATKAQYFRTRQVCESCNGGWMSALEVWFQNKARISGRAELAGFGTGHDQVFARRG